jgi:DMSO/TMAO reductase YedYZ molybdopterin-dependent catalytic subunit
MAGRREIEGEIIMGWADRKRPTLDMRKDAQGRVVRVATSVGDLQGLITPTDLRYVVVQLDAPDPVHPDDWSLSIGGEVERPIELTLGELQRFPGTMVRCVHECSGSEADLFDYLKSGGETYGCNRCDHVEGKPNRLDPEAEHQGIVSGGEWTGVPLAAVLEQAGVKPGGVSVLAQGFDRGLPAEWATHGALAIPDEEISFEKSLPLEKALDRDTLLAWALNGEYIRHIHGGPVRLITPGWSGHWSVKWLQKLEVLDHIPPLYYQTQYFYHGQTSDDPDKEMITAMGVKTLITEPRDDDPPLPRGTHVIRGLAWSGAGKITRVEVSVDGGKTWNDAHREQPQERWLWVRWSHLWHAGDPGKYAIMARATDEAGRVQPQIGWNVLRKNFDGIVPVDVEVK